MRKLLATLALGVAAATTSMAMATPALAEDDAEAIAIATSGAAPDGLFALLGRTL